MRILLFFWTILLTGAINAQEVLKSASIPETSVGIGYCDDYPAKYSAVGLERKATISGAIFLPAKKMENRGDRMIAFRFLNRSSDVKNCQIFIYTSLDEEPVYTQPFESQGTGWNYIYLDTPYELKNEDIYIGYSVLTSEMPFGYIEPLLNTDADYVRIGNGAWTHLSSVGLPGVHCMQAIVSGGDYSDRRQLDVALDRMVSSEYVQVETPFIPEIEISNRGVKTIHYLNMEYAINGISKSILIEELSIPFGMSSVIALPELTLPLGDYTLEIKAFQVNGETDEDESNNLLSASIACITKYFQRNLLLEQFTGQGCGYCPEGASALKAAVKGNEDRIVWVAHHAGYGSDDMTINESVEYTWFYNDVATYAPACMLDRTRLKTLLVTPGPGTVFDSRLTKPSMIETLLAIPAYAQLNAQSTFDVDSRELVVTVEGEITQELPYAHLNVFITQDGISAYQVNGSNTINDYQHDHAVRLVLSDVWGDMIDYKDNKFSKTYTCTVPSSIGNFECKVSDMHVVAFLADYREDRPNECQVHNSISIPLDSVALNVLSIDTDQLKIYSIGKHILIDGDYESVRIYSMQGTLIKDMGYTKNHNIAKVSSGMYIVRVVIGNKVRTQKVVVK